MSRYALLIALIAAFAAWISCGDQIPTIPVGAGKVTVEEPRSYIVWECGANQWMDTADSTWTIFFHGQFRIYIEGTTVEISEYISPTSKLVYEAGHPGRPGFSLYANGSWCAATTELIGPEIPDVRIWRGDVDWLYQDDPQNNRYVLYENDLAYQIARIKEDDAVEYIDFQSVHHRDNSPMLDVGSQAVWPVNVDMVKRDSLEVLGQVPADDRPYLLYVICQGAECPDFVQDIELHEQLVRSMIEGDTPQYLTVETVTEGVEESVVEGELGEGVEEPAVEGIEGETDEGTTTIIYTLVPPQLTTLEFATQEDEHEHDPEFPHGSHRPEHLGNACGTGPMPANSPPGCAEWDEDRGELVCSIYYRCNEWGEDGCEQWSGPYGPGSKDMTFCDKKGTTWISFSAYLDALTEDPPDHVAVPPDPVEGNVYCAHPKSWERECKSGALGPCAYNWSECNTSLPGYKNNGKHDPTPAQLSNWPTHCQWLTHSGLTSVTKGHCGYLPRPEGVPDDEWPPEGFTKQ